MTNARIRFFLYCDLSDLSVDYAVPLADYPEFPRDEGVDLYQDIHKSALGSNFWVYTRGTSYSWNMNWIEVSDDAAATMGLIVGSAFMYSPHVVIWEGQGLDTVSQGSLFSITDERLKGTFFCENNEWRPQEVKFGLWNFTTNWRKQA